MSVNERPAAADELARFVELAASEHGIPGCAVAVTLDGVDLHASHGVTSSENPLAVDQNTLFVLGSVTKTVTATAIMRLADEGKIALDESIVRYVPDFRLPDKDAAERITLLSLLNHTSGLDWGLTRDTGEGDDALARYVAMLSEMPLIADPGRRFSYSQAGYNLLGRAIENVTGLCYEAAIASLILEPLGMSQSFFMLGDVITRRFAVGHNRNEAGQLAIARLWRRWRGENPGGGLVASASDLLRWARFHLDLGVEQGHSLPLSAETVRRMREPTVDLRASNLGTAVGIGWFLRSVEGIPVAGHTGSANGQFSDILLVPSRNFAVVSLANAGPNGIPFNQSVLRWALDHFLGLVDSDPVPLPFDEHRAQEVVGEYQNNVMDLTIRAERDALRLEVLMKPDIRAASSKELPPDHAPFEFGFLPGDDDEYIITSGAFVGQRGFFSRNQAGAIVGVDLAGRLFARSTSAR